MNMLKRHWRICLDNFNNPEAMKKTFLFVCIFACCDHFLTQIGLNVGLREGNPIGSWIIGKFGLFTLPFSAILGLSILWLIWRISEIVPDKENKISVGVVFEVALFAEIFATFNNLINIILIYGLF